MLEFYCCSASVCPQHCQLFSQLYLAALIGLKVLTEYLQHYIALAASHMVKAADLKRASKLIREQRRHRQASQHGTQKQSQASEVVDVD